MMGRGIYTPLSTHDDVFEVRLLRVLPSLDSDGMICCSLITYRLHPDERPHLYDALSYVWGDPHITQEITVDGYPFHFTINLHAALQQLRDHYLERILWIDAICIDQGNPDEVARQILSHAFIAKLSVCSYGLERRQMRVTLRSKVFASVEVNMHASWRRPKQLNDCSCDHGFCGFG